MTTHIQDLIYKGFEISTYINYNKTEYSVDIKRECGEVVQGFSGFEGIGGECEAIKHAMRYIDRTIIENRANEYAKDFIYCDQDENDEARPVWEVFEHFSEGDIQNLEDILTQDFIAFANEVLLEIKGEINNGTRT